jgi:hypothetical protein
LREIAHNLNQASNAVIGQNNTLRGNGNIVIGRNNKITAKKSWVFSSNYEGKLNEDLVLDKWKI